MEEIQAFDIPNDVSWYAVNTRTTHEKRVASLLTCQGFEWFIPLYKCRRRWSDRIKETDQPLFPGYVFCRFDLRSRVQILKTPSVLDIVGIRGVPTAIYEEEITAIQRMQHSGLELSPHPFMRIGQRVRINGGCLDGVEGLIQDVRKRRYLIVSVTLLQRSVSVEIDSAWAVPISSPPRARNSNPAWSSL